MGNNRYSDDWTRLRAYCHFMLHGLICALALQFSIWGWIALLSSPMTELYQWMTDDEYDGMDGLCDLAEGLAGGVVIGLIFFAAGL